MSNPPDFATGDTQAPRLPPPPPSEAAALDSARRRSYDLWFGGSEAPESGRFTSEGAQEMLADEDAGTLAAQRGALVADDFTGPSGAVGEETQIINMGPQHPSTHGVLRLQVELEGETIRRVKPIIGYLHTGMEQTAEVLTYAQGGTNVTRMDYLSPFFEELCFALATERLLGIKVPPRAEAIRILMTELNRIASHLIWLATQGLDVGALSMMLYGWREREECLRFFEKVTGLRMNHNYIRVGGVSCDLPDGWEDDLAALLAKLPPGIADYQGILDDNPIFRERTIGVGVITADECRAYGVTGPILRAAGVAWDLRRAFPYSGIERYQFEVPVGSGGDTYDRYLVRVEEMKQSIRIVEQVAASMPAGDYRTDDRKVTPPPRARLDQSMEALIHHFKLFTEGFKVPAGEVYQAVESPRGELGMYLVSDGGAKPWRLHVRGPSFANVQALPVMLVGGLIADTVATLASVDPLLGDVDR